MVMNNQAIGIVMSLFSGGIPEEQTHNNQITLDRN